jgi:hypothetical protein
LDKCGECYCRDHEGVPKAKAIRQVAVARPPCRHLGAETGESVLCNTGCPNSGQTTLRPLFACAVHGATTREHFVRGRMSCNPAICKQYEAPIPKPPSPELEASIRSTSPPPMRPRGWCDRADVQEVHRRLLHEMVAAPPTYPGGFEGDGIVIPGGGPYWPSAWVAVKALRHFGCNLPVEIWHRGHGEPVEPTMLHGMNARTVDATTFLPQGRIPGGWESKLFAAERCRFRRVLVLDADITVFSDASRWFDLLDSRPVAVSPDCSTQNNFVHFDLHGFGRDATGAVNSGVQLLDKEKAWPFLMTARWLNDHSDYYYGRRSDGRNVIGYGDQDCTRLALHATKTPFHFFGPAPRYQDMGVVVKSYSGSLLYTHRWHGKLFHPAWGKPSYSAQFSPYNAAWPFEQEVHGWLREFGEQTKQIPGWFDFADIYGRAVSECADGGTLVEVGCWHGKSLVYLLQKAKEAGRGINVVGVDNFGGSVGDDSQAATLAAYDVEAVCRRNADAVGYPYRLLAEPSVTAAARFADASLDFVFLDASHDYESVRDDLAAWLRKVKPTGVVAGHDFDLPGVRRAVLERIPEAELELPGRSWRRKRR